LLREGYDDSDVISTATSLQTMESVEAMNAKTSACGPLVMVDSILKARLPTPWGNIVYRLFVPSSATLFIGKLILTCHHQCLHGSWSETANYNQWFFFSLMASLLIT
jgi:hypothetical protein